MAGENYVTKGPPTTGAAGEQNRQQQTDASLADRTDNVESGGTQQPGKNLPRALRVSGAEVLHDARQRLRTYKQDIDDYIRKNPTKAVFTALGMGFVLGLMRPR